MIRFGSVFLRALLNALLVLSLVISLAACSDQTGPSGSSSVPGSELSQTQSTSSQTPQPSPSPTPEPEPFMPDDIFGSKLNPYADVDFPDNFTVYAASFDIGIEKFGGKPHLILSMTAEGNIDEAIKFLAELAGIEDEQSVTGYIAGFKDNGFGEFQDPDGNVFTVRKTDRNDDRYEYVDGLHADITLNIPDEDSEIYIQLIRDNFSVNALMSVADYFNTEPLFGECQIAVNKHKKEVSIEMLYPVNDAANVQTKLTENAEGTWYDPQNGKMGLSYGIFGIELHFDVQDSNIYVIEKTNQMGLALSSYTEPEISLSKLGFGFGQDIICGVYEQREPHYMSVAIHRAEWGEFNEDWNIEFMDEVNGYSLWITYFENEEKFHISAEKDGSRATYYYYMRTEKYDGDSPDKDTVTRIFNDVFNTTGEDFYDEPVEHLQRLVYDRFGMSVLELYELPPK